MTYSFGELIELVKRAEPTIQDYDMARSFLAGLLFTLADDSMIESLGKNLERSIEGRKRND